MASTPLLHAILHRMAQHPDAPALLFRQEQTSYGALHRLASAAADQLRAFGLPDRRPVGIVARKTPQAVALILGCLMVRQSFVLPSVELGETALRTLFNRADCARVLAPDTSVAGRVPGLETTVVWDGAPPPLSPTQPGTGLDGGLPEGPPPDECGFMLTTSGSTGLPKVVPLPASAVDAFTDWGCAQFGIEPGRTVLNYAPLNFDLCLLDIWATLKGGGCVALVEEDQATNPVHLLTLLESTPIHMIQAVPMLYRLLLDATRLDGRAFEAVRHVVFTGDSMPPSSLAALPRLFPKARFSNIYGCTETNDSFLHEVDLANGPPLGPLPIGAPLPGVRALIVGEDGAVIERAGVGELLVSTPFQTASYLDPAANEGKFSRRRCDGVEITYFHSGDLVRRHDDGSITLQGRKDFHVKVRGVRVNMQEVERVLQEHGGVQEAAVIAVPDDMAGHRLHAIVRRRPQAGVDSLELRRHCAGCLPRTAIPSGIEFVETVLPKTSTGKVDRRQLLQCHLKGDHDGVPRFY
ncbi:class I adenylate-forming enzyme family protein [Azospirillum griseum]|uniref:Carbohydrate-binding protein n=1 Tax=Azospirillum griseum TaxID=2496639 RepID=A0A3S0HY72_9PROT|nr:AMP-binding protein [Azospirillum griseum]RTR21099.1 carbohydrate-binding protein [Azospirillum griseum]